MNKKQDWVIYVGGVLLAWISFTQGTDQEDWFFEHFVPVLVLVFALRSRPRAAAADSKSLGVGLLVVVAATLFGRVEHKLNGIESAAEDAKSAAENAQTAAEDPR